MRNKPNLMHLLIVPLITILIGNGITIGIIWQVSEGAVHFWKNIGVAVMVAYTLYLVWRTQSRPVWPLAAMVCAAIALNYMGLPILIWLGAVAALFALMRAVVLGSSRSVLTASFVKDFLAASLGLVAVLFLAPASLTAAIAAFVLVQLCYELSWGKSTVRSEKRDRFKESLCTAERILEVYAK